MSFNLCFAWTMSSLKGGSAGKSTRCKGWRDGDWTKRGDLTLQMFWSCMTWELFCIGSSHDSWAVVSITMHVSSHASSSSWFRERRHHRGCSSLWGEPLLLSRLVWESPGRPGVVLSQLFAFGKHCTLHSPKAWADFLGKERRVCMVGNWNAGF